MGRRDRGFTLLELMVTLAVLAIILGIAVPSFKGLLVRARIGAAANQLVAGLQTARMLAIRSNSRVEMCPSTDGATCSGSDWRRFIVVVQKGGPTVERDVQMNGGSMVAIASPAVTAATPNKVWFLADGFVRTGTAAGPTQTGTISVCTTQLGSENARDVQFDVSRVSVSRQTRAACGAPGN
jgi:type IV fimbrial biogenesis protein FimT